jgi:predicted nucleic acid-binding protein
VTLPLVLDSAGLDALTDSQPSPHLRALLREAHARGRDVLVPAVICAELCRGAARTRRAEVAVARHDATRGQLPAVQLVPTDFALARQVGAVLHGAGAADSRDLADAHVVAVCAVHGGGLVVTSDRDDIERLAQAVPSARILVRPAR